MKVRYFAWMKRTVGLPEEEVTLPAEVRTVGDLVVWLRARSAGHAEALAAGAAFGAAVDQKTASFDASLADAREVAFFPPFTGG
jgi:molybdopterin synthase sulfur carrier subunit